MSKKKSCFALSTVKCKKCGKVLKVNVIDRQPDASLCYPCYHASVIAIREGYHGQGRCDRRFEEGRNEA